MIIENLTVGQTYKYKELCLLLKVEEKKTGKSRDYQFKDWRRFFDFDKVGQKYTITNIHNVPLEKVDNRGKSINSRNNNQVKYIQNMELLILDLLAQDSNGTAFLSKNKLFKALNMINDNYAFCKVRIPKLSKFMEIEQITVEEWYDSTDGTLKRNLEKALDNLRNQSLVIWSSAITVCQILDNDIKKDAFYVVEETNVDEYDEETTEYKLCTKAKFLHREATEDEKRFIIHTERDMMELLKCENKQEIIKNGLWEQFSKIVKEIILKEFKIAYYYDSYKILFNEDHILEKHKSLLEKEKKNEEQKILNDGIIERLENNTQKKQNRAKKKIEDEEFNKMNDKSKNKLLIRTEDNYLENNNELIKTLINDNSETIKDKVRRTKLD